MHKRTASEILLSQNKFQFQSIVIVSTSTSGKKIDGIAFSSH